jgi:hypothetical protein
MDELTEVEVFLNSHSTHSTVSGDHKVVSDAFSKIAGDYIRDHDLQRENFFRKELRDKGCQARFLALYILLKFRQQGIVLQPETAKEIKRLLKSKSKENRMLVMCVQRRLKQDIVT